jgi:hypothetical protein
MPKEDLNKWRYNIFMGWKTQCGEEINYSQIDIQKNPKRYSVDIDKNILGTGVTTQ